jgi:hypothetical protein
MTYNFKDCIRGNTFPGVQFDLSINGSPKDLTGATVNLFLDGKITFTTALETLIFSDRVHGKVQLPRQIIHLAPKNYHVKLIYIFADGETHTYLEGYWNILPE